MNVSYKVSTTAECSNRFYDKTQQLLLDETHFNTISSGCNILEKDNLENFGDLFLETWINNDVLKLHKLIKMIASETLILNDDHSETNDSLADIAMNKEIPQTLIEIISIVDNSLTDSIIEYLEQSQDLICDAFLALSKMFYFSNKILNDFGGNVIDVVRLNFSEYSPNARIAALNLLTVVFRENSMIIKLCLSGQRKFIKNLSKMVEKSNDSDFNCAVVELSNQIIRNAVNNKLKDVEYLTAVLPCFYHIFINSLQKNEFLIDCYSGLFYLMFLQPQYILVEFTEGFTLSAFKYEHEFIKYYLLQILKLIYCYFPEERLIIFHQQIDFSFLNNCIEINQILAYSLASLVWTIIDRGEYFIQGLIEFHIFEHLYDIFINSSFEIKNMILQDFSLAIIKSNLDQLNYYFTFNMDLILFESMTLIDSLSLCLDSIKIVADNFPQRVKVPELIESVEAIVPEDELTKDKIAYILSIATNESLEENFE
ncbi:hypothetical protein TRFO_28911 [Tritrichomonas foetus]|uniref:Uncharacterized protein n=1 Tax=Tritrichomonas foetus TaxID=1144522 RepID=A0A1J4JXD4_9EUKA|nr:hypothetical protein TRFO_28911 [Tritrichomonas foetus]|eukprot:OHT03651.1 hypothetical protein TRFO_28911 [Tritrichomonas foetus]